MMKLPVKLLLLVTLASRPGRPVTAQSSPLTVTLEVNEEVPVGEVIGNLKSRFSLPEGSSFGISFPTEETSRLFQLDGRTGEIRVRGRLDREALCPGSKLTACERGFNAEVRRGDTGADEVCSVRVLVRDINDQRPSFHPKDKPFRVSIAESDTPPSFYSLPTAEDADSAGRDSVVYSLVAKGDDVTGAGLHFRLATDDRAGRAVPRLELLRPLDRETRDGYELELLAWDAEFPEDRDRTDVLVRVLDANDNRPEIHLATRALVVSECDELHRPLLKLEATDADEDKRVRFGIARTASPEVAGAFYIADGHLRQNRSLDYETVRAKVLYVPLVAEDFGGLKSEAEVEVRVTDCNDHYPNVSLQLLDATVAENDPAEKLLARVMVRDEDQGENGTVECAVAEARRLQFELTQRLTDGPHVTFYKLRKLADVRFDREELGGDELTVELVCRDHGRPVPKEARSSVTVRVLDENDNAPVPDSRSYRFRVPENRPADSFVGRVSATDRDAGENARLTFRLDASGEQFFSLRPRPPAAAELHARLSFDRETRDRYAFVLTVEDNGAKEKLTATVPVEVLIDDEDDSAPAFSQKEYAFRVAEDFGRNSSDRLVGEVEATDGDVGYNAEIRYEVGRDSQPGGGVRFHFRGSRLFARGNLDRERQEVINLDLLALNRGPRQHRGVAHASVTLLDVNDNSPELIGARRTYNLSDSSPAGTQVLQLASIDPDAGENGTVRYSLVGPDHGHFSVDAVHGIVTLVRAVKVAAAAAATTGAAPARSFRLVARATDGGRRPLSSPDEALFVSVLSGELSGGAGGGGGGGQAGNSDRSHRPESDRHFLILLCLAGAVFVIFLVLLTVLIFVHRKGGRDAATTRESQGAWYDKASTDPAEEAPDCGGEFRFPDVVKAATADSPTTPHQRGSAAAAAAAAFDYQTAVAASAAASTSLVIDNARARSLVRGKFPSFGYIAAAEWPSREHQQQQQQQQRQHQHQHQHQFQLLTMRSCNGYESFQQQQQPHTLGSDRLPRKVYGPRVEAEGGGGGCDSGAVQENRYAMRSTGGGRQDGHGYAMLTAADTTALANPAVCKTPYMTSSFV